MKEGGAGLDDRTGPPRAYLSLSLRMRAKRTASRLCLNFMSTASAPFTDKNGHILPYVHFDGGKAILTDEAIEILDNL